MRRCSWQFAWTLTASLLGGCDDDRDAADAASPVVDAEAGVEELPDVYLPTIDADDPFEGFEPADAPDAELAYSPLLPLPDAAVVPEAGPTPPSGCLALSPGDERTIESELTAARTWRRIEPEQCPATRITDRDVAYVVHVVCAWTEPIMLDVEMLGADQLVAQDAVADPVLVVYDDTSALISDPFSCLAVSDDATFDGVVVNSSRIDNLVIDVGERVAIVATSYERPDQHGVGPYRLELRAH